MVGLASSALSASSTAKPSSTSPCLTALASRVSSSIIRTRSAFIPKMLARRRIQKKRCARSSDQQRQDSRGYQRAGPDCVEVDPGAAQDGQSDPLINQHRDCSGHCDHRAGMHQHYGYRLPGRMRVCRGHVMSVGGIRRHPDQYREQHQARAMRRRHQERPQRQLRRIHTHRNPPRMRARPRKAKQPERNQCGGADRTKIIDREEQAQPANDRNDRCDRREMSDRDRTKRPHHFRAPPLLQPQRHREQPAHRRVDPVIRAERRDGYPRPRRAHRYQRSSRLRWRSVISGGSALSSAGSGFHCAMNSYFLEEATPTVSTPTNLKQAPRSKSLPYTPQLDVTSGDGAGAVTNQLETRCLWKTRQFSTKSTTALPK